jgi:hypothetical protein
MPTQRPLVATLPPNDVAARKRIAFYRKVQRIKLLVGRSWKNLRRGCLDLLGRDVKHSTSSVGKESRIFAKRVCRETGLKPEQESPGLTTRDSDMARKRQPIARIPFTDGVECDVFQDKDDCQFVVDDDGDKVYGYWVLMDDPDEPAIIDAE